MDIWSGVTDASLTDRQGKIVLLKLLRQRSGALITQIVIRRMFIISSQNEVNVNGKKGRSKKVAQNPRLKMERSHHLFFHSKRASIRSPLDNLISSFFIHILRKNMSQEMESVGESLLRNARCEESSFGRVGSRHQRGQQRHCPAKLRNNAQNRTEFPQEMEKLRNGA